MAYEELKPLQQVELEILQAVKAVCEKKQLRYFLGCGTLLGAVRHQGFIPWDDDVDILMPYPDFNRFMQIAQDELNPKFFLQNCESDSGVYSAYAKVRMNGTTMMRHNETGYCVHHGVWIDIFPLAPIQSDADWKRKKNIIKFSNLLLMDQYFSGCHEGFKSDCSPIVMFMMHALLSVPRGIRKSVHKWCMHRLAAGGKAPYLAEVWNTLGERVALDVFEGEATELLFEGVPFAVPPKYKTYLETIYGDYMTPPPEAERIGHGDLIVDLKNGYQNYMDTVRN